MPVAEGGPSSGESMGSLRRPSSSALTPGLSLAPRPDLVREKALRMRGPSRVTDPQSLVFLNMYLRKMQRRVKGTQQNEVLCELFVYGLLVLATVWVQSILEVGDVDDEAGPKTKTDVTIDLSWWLGYFLLVGALFFLFRDSPFFKMLRCVQIHYHICMFSHALFRDTSVQTVDFCLALGTCCSTFLVFAI